MAGPILHFSRAAERQKAQRARLDRAGADTFVFREPDLAEHTPEAADSPNPNAIIVIATDPSEAVEVAGRTVEKNIAKRKDAGTTYPNKPRDPMDEIEAEHRTETRV